ncbi:MAG TPA: DUF2182 domain-containing protein [Dyella sp.]|uniref:DUF2182 domain-containing protein n=1 Tax=Dyella sp. TaxID=1869338 RepID=UPI002F955838
MMNTLRVERFIFVVIVALIFTISAITTIRWSTSMVGMPGDSMAWQPMCGQGWIGAAVSFVGMWAVMMVAMMLPSLSPLLWRHLPSGTPGSVAITAVGYFSVWIVLGAAIFPVGAMLAVTRIPLPSLGTGLAVSIAGALQFTAWKARHLACCRGIPAPASSEVGVAFRHGLRMGMHCCCACVSFTFVLLAMGVMDLRAMAVVTTALMLERFAPNGTRAARSVGVIAIGAGAIWMVKTLLVLR